VRELDNEGINKVTWWSRAQADAKVLILAKFCNEYPGSRAIASLREDPDCNNFAIVVAFDSLCDPAVRGSL